MNSKCLKRFISHRSGKRVYDNLCLFRGVSYSKYGDERYAERMFFQYAGSRFSSIRDFPGVTLPDLPDIERFFAIDIDVFEIHETSDVPAFDGDADDLNESEEEGLTFEQMTDDQREVWLGDHVDGDVDNDEIEEDECDDLPESNAGKNGFTQYVYKSAQLNGGKRCYLDLCRGHFSFITDINGYCKTLMKCRFCTYCCKRAVDA